MKLNDIIFDEYFISLNVNNDSDDDDNTIFQIKYNTISNIRSFW